MSIQRLGLLAILFTQSLASDTVVQVFLEAALRSTT